MWVVALPDQRIWPLSGTVRCDSRANAGRTEIVDKSLILLFCRLSIRHAQQQGGMNGYEYIFSRDPFKVFNGVCNITIGASNPCLRQRPVEKFSSRPDERPSFAVFMISRLLTNQHDSGRRFAVTEDCLRRIFPERAIPTASRRCPDFEQAAGCGD